MEGSVKNKRENNLVNFPVVYIIVNIIYIFLL